MNAKKIRLEELKFKEHLRKLEQNPDDFNPTF